MHVASITFSYCIACIFMNTMDNHVTLPVFYFLRLSIVLLLAVAASALPQQSELDFALRLRAMKGLADRLYGVPTPELDVFTTLRVANRADEELCFRRGSATVEHDSTSTVLAQGIVPEFCVEANGVRNVDLWAHGERKAWPQDVRDDVAAERLRGELQFQVSLDLVDDEGTLEVTAHCTLHQNYTRTNCLSKITVLFYEGY